MRFIQLLSCKNRFSLVTSNDRNYLYDWLKFWIKNQFRLTSCQCVGLLYILFFQLNKNTALTETLLTVYGYDQDVRGNSPATFSIVGGGIGQKYFRLVSRASRKRSTSGDSFDLKLKKQLDFSNDKSFQFTIQVICLLCYEQFCFSFVFRLPDTTHVVSVFDQPYPSCTHRYKNNLFSLSSVWNDPFVLK